jgi:hypothetical protein
VALTRTEESVEALTIYADADAVYPEVVRALGAVRRVKTSDPKFRRVVGRIRSGTGNMNSATVTCSVEILGAQQSRLNIGATAQEGLIKQHTAPRAISRLLDHLATVDFPTEPQEGGEKSSEGVSPTRQLAELGLLRDQGVVTQEEFESKKAELLRRI